MNHRSVGATLGRVLVSIGIGMAIASCSAPGPRDAGGAAAGSATQAPLPPPPENWTTAQDHQNMMAQLGITELRPGPSGTAPETAPNAANYDEARANPFPVLPDALRMENGRKVTSARQWREKRRPEIVELFEREVLGRVPKNVPKVTWSVVEQGDSKVGPRSVHARRLVGKVDNSAYPAISVNIDLLVVTPEDNTGPVPVMIMFGRGRMPGAPIAAPAGRGLGGPGGPGGPGGRGGAPGARAGGPGPGAGAAGPRGGGPGAGPPAPRPGADPPATEQLINAGWGYAYLDPGSVQADNGAGLTKGIIGLTNKGQPRKPDDWGSLRAWGWGASRALDYFETDPTIDAKRVGIEGVSRYGKAALVTMAFDERFAVVLIGSSGEGGAKPHRRNFGEAVENLTGSGEYHWMAGNFLKYGAAKASFGSMNAGDIPVDSNELLALCAPRATFISYGVPEQGDAKWLDQRGSFMAAIAAQPVFRLLGAKDLGRPDDYARAQLPPVNEGLLDGRLAWRQHDGGHTDAPNWKYFIPWAERELWSQPKKK